MSQWENLTLGNLSYYLDWAREDSRIVGIAPWHLLDRPPGLPAGKLPAESLDLGLVNLPESLQAYRTVGRAIIANSAK